VPLKRMGTESEVSSVICFLLSEGAAYISGVTIRIDGASSLGTRDLSRWPITQNSDSL
jgi:citronellol/citronellal dehydrogenase